MQGSLWGYNRKVPSDCAVTDYLTTLFLSKNLGYSEVR